MEKSTAVFCLGCLSEEKWIMTINSGYVILGKEWGRRKHCAVMVERL